ncbi:MAG: SRPBCC family protein [Phycisphaerales bacterium]|nr:SRPBCC family protein [Phycisphaerales bacterium]
MWMYWAIGGVAVIVVLFVIVIVVGRSLPKAFSAATSIQLNQSPEAIWTAINDYQKFPVSARMRKRTEPLPDAEGLPCWREHIGSSRIRVTTLESRAPSRLVRRMEDEVVPMTMRTEYTIESTGSGARLRCAAEGSVEDGTWHAPVFRFMIRVFNGVKSGQKQYLASVARHFNESPRFD